MQTPDRAQVHQMGTPFKDKVMINSTSFNLVLINTYFNQLLEHYSKEKKYVAFWLFTLCTGHR